MIIFPCVVKSSSHQSFTARRKSEICVSSRESDNSERKCNMC
jgi:hypothetical protein